MENINDTLLVNINLSSTEESTIEIVTYMGQHRAVINTFRGKDAELFYKTILSRNMDYEKLSRLSEVSIPEPIVEIADEKEIFEELSFYNSVDAYAFLNNLFDIFRDNTHISLADIKILADRVANSGDIDILYYNLKDSYVIMSDADYRLVLKDSEKVEEDIDDQNYEIPDLELATN